ncbi:hypothetical protein BU24DRAFT_415907 [Aaosphaeria arxii CBS 175.79]|uniref:Uncharacterized protein n=1 Tax=Aaosphaeria arxii CBS 175.79 TaxID=1450172 RepID=A0A6A5X6Q0_9PLEO|nr:uncharacterized protein BU24DRAFT_415907 [Aaosphaeria arxii CBS 175.79]KAF2008556.1 hypothetical protein BU24DRAFT_415907 [Aaosphaeria arxii CBS 175.79]
MVTKHGALTENIALLSLCGTTLEPLMDYTLPVDPPGAIHHHLSLQHEQQVAEAFAILLANTDDPNAVGAICVEEQPNATGLLIRMAVNSGSQQERTSTFDRIICALKRLTASKDEETFFKEIVVACQSRLLVRLRSSHAKSHRRHKVGRQAVISRLCDGIKVISRLRINPAATAAIKPHTDLLECAFAKLEAMSFTAAHSESGSQSLYCIISKVEMLLTSTDIVALLMLIPNDIPTWPESAVRSLVKSLNGLAQYRSAAHYLLRRAHKDPIFHHLKIAEISSETYPEGLGTWEPLSVQHGIFTRSLQGYDKSVQRSEISSQLKSMLGMSHSELESSIDCHATMTKRVHAEIQLLLYSMKHPPLLQPRIICSNKHACLLCALFIQAHGKFHIRSCHGRLYPRWRIPLPQIMTLPESSRLQIQQAVDDLNQFLEAKLRTYLLRSRSRYTFSSVGSTVT